MLVHVRQTDVDDAAPFPSLLPASNKAVMLGASAASSDSDTASMRMKDSSLIMDRGRTINPGLQWHQWITAPIPVIAYL